jgi:hypothetical protein
MAINFPSTPTDGDIVSGYIWVESENAWRRLPVDASIGLDNLNDVDISTPADGEVLAYDSISGEWVNQSLPEPILTLEGLSDTNIDTPVDGEVLIYDSTSGEWVNDSLPEPVLTFSGLEDTTITSTTTDQIVRWNGTVWVNDTAKTNSIANDAITTAKIANSNVTRAKLASGLAAFTASQTITASNASWPVPALGNNTIVKVTVIGSGGGGNCDYAGTYASNGNTTTFNAGGAGSVSAAGGKGGGGVPTSNNTRASGQASTPGLASGNGGMAAVLRASGYGDEKAGASGTGGAISIAYLNLSGISTVNVTIGAGGAGLAGGATGGRGEVIVEYVAA